MSATQPHVYNELVFEYSAALHYLIDYIKNSTEKTLILKVFTPQQHDDLKTKLDLQPIYIEVTNKQICLDLLTKVIKFFERILHYSFTSFSITQSIYTVLDDFEYIISHLDMHLKLSVFEIIFTVTENIQIDKLPPKLQEIFLRFSTYFEQIVYDVLDNNSVLGNCNVAIFEALAIKFLNSQIGEVHYQSRNARICDFMYKKIYLGAGSKNAPFKNLFNVAAAFSPQFFDNTTQSTELISLVCNDYNFSCVVMLKKQMEEELKFMNSQNTMDNPCTIWNNVIKVLKETLVSKFCDNSCNLDKNLQLVIEITNMAVQVQISLLNFHFKRDTKRPLNIFSEKTEFVFCSLIKNITQHLRTCKNQISFSKIIEGISACVFTCSENDLPLLFKILSFPIGKQPIDKIFFDKENLVSLHEFINTHQCLEDGITLKYLLHFFRSLSSDIQRAKQRHFKIKNDAIKVIENLPRNSDSIDTVNTTNLFVFSRLLAFFSSFYK